MSPRRKIHLWSVLAVLLVGNHAQATEPNENFAQATVLAPGVLSVSDDLMPGFVSYPDTMLGIRDTFGEIYFVDDDGSPIGDGHASGVGGVPTNSGSIAFAVSGYPDEFFQGNHGEFGEYKVFVDVYDFFDDLVNQFSQSATLQPGIVDEYSFSNFEWIGGSYDVYIDNTVGDASAADVDFFTFTSLTAGASFTAEVTQQVYSGFDSHLGWFSDTGALLDFDDDDGVETLSLLQGTVPANGQLTFAVTGYGDDNFLGEHIQDAVYALELSINGVPTPGDYNQNGTVDAADYTLWRDNLGAPAGALPNDVDGGIIGQPQYDTWKANFGATGGASSGSPADTIANVPEPASLTFVAIGLVMLAPFVRRDRPT